MNITYQAEFCLTRKAVNSTAFYLVRNGQYFSANNVGFESDNLLTVYAMGNEGVIISAGYATAKLYGPGIENVQFDPAVQTISTGTDYIEVQIDEGTYNFN